MTIMAGISIRFVPAGLRFVPASSAKGEKARWQLRGTVLLTPLTGEGADHCGQSVELQSWPSKIWDLVGKGDIQVQMSPVGPVASAGRPAPAPLDPNGWLMARSAGIPPAAKDLEALTTRWRELMTYGPSGFEPLAEALKQTGSNVAVSQIAKPSTRHPDIVANGRGEMGLLLALERGSSVLERLRSKGQACRSNERLRTRDPAKQSGIRRETMPWLTAEGAHKPPEQKDLFDQWAKADRARRSKQANAGLAGARAEADDQADRRRKYNAATAATLDTALNDLAKARASCQSPSTCARITAAPARDTLQQSLDAARLRHVAATQPTEDGSAPTAPSLDNPARARFFAVQSQPALARLFGLAVDVTVELDDPLRAKLEQARLPQAAAAGGEPLYAFVTARIGAECGGRVIWTCAKLRLPAMPDLRAHFWACNREEMDARALGWPEARLLESSLCSQVDGLLDLGAVRVEGGVRNPRYDLATLDIPRVSEADVHVDAQATERPGVAQPTPVATMASGGLVLVDRWRQYQAVAQATDSLGRPSPSAPGTIVIDAEDLTTGLRLDVGIDTKGGRTWRSLVGRRIEYSKKEDTALFTRVLKGLVPNEEERLALDDALLTLPARLRRNAAEEWSGTDHPVATAFVEEVVAQWHGAPLGIDLHGSDVLPNTPKPDVDATAALPLALTYRLPTTGALPPRCCFGWSYRVGVRPVLAGGVVRTVAEAARLYDEGAEGRLCLPPVVMDARRVLRHERIEAPVVATPLGILRRKLRGAQATATELVVRSIHDEKGEIRPLGPTATHRVLVPPPVPLEFADRHDVFTDAMLERYGTGSDASVRPRGGLRDVAFDQQAFGTFPVWSTQRTSEGEEYPDDATLPEPTGDAIFEPRLAGMRPERRKQPYYPDPAADYMVFRLVGEDGVPLPGKPLVVPTRRPGVAFPDVTPVAIELVATRVRCAAPDQCRLAQGRSAVHLDADEVIQTRPGRGRVVATRVTVTLEPGERFQLDIWCLPASERLADIFDLPESVALVAQAASVTTDTCLRGTAFVTNLAAVLAADAATVGGKLSHNEPLDQLPTGCGPGQLALPGLAEIEVVAELIAEGASRSVVPELAARTTLWVTHAVDKPLRPPSLNATPKLTLDRIDDLEHGDTMRVNGAFAFDAATTGFVEVLGSGPSLLSGTFDDPNRGRSETDRARGIWPDAGSAAGWRRPHLVFGFHVNADGTVELQDEQARLLRVEVPKPPTDAKPGERDTFDLSHPTEGSTSSAPDRFSDPKARVVTLRLLAGSRTAPFIRNPQGVALGTAEQTVGSSGPLETLRVLLPATKAPARVAALTILPAFNTRQTGLETVRTVKLRVRARRPWFSSGPGERFGIVLWPPALFDGALPHTSGNDVARGYNVGDGEPETMDLRGFSDLDLGPGGAFVSRWGADPTKPGPRSTDWLIPPAAFLDFPQNATRTTGLHTPWRPGDGDADKREVVPWRPDDDDADKREVVYVPRADMPLPVQPGGAAADAPAPRMTVALLTYRPRFDIDTEHWYFDVAINPDAAVEPFIRLGLVRYQANAPPELRVSEPIVEWAQLMPKRTLRVTPQDTVTEDGKVYYPLCVSVAGPGQFGSVGKRVSNPSGSFMAFTVLRRGSDGVENVVGEHHGGMQGLGEEEEMAWSDPSQAWQATFRLDEDPFAPKAAGTYSVLAVERHAMNPSNYASKEPFDPVQNASDGVSWSGPRFAARVMLGLNGAQENKLSDTQKLYVHSDQPP